MAAIFELDENLKKSFTIFEAAPNVSKMVPRPPRFFFCSVCVQYNTLYMEAKYSLLCTVINS